MLASAIGKSFGCLKIIVWMVRVNPTEETSPMHDLLVGLTFIAMVLSPAIVAAFSGSSETNPE
jgi:hypothetical protein